eukprot:scaffold132481_cov12-Tisochrysis_lutea.AAC.1
MVASFGVMFARAGVPTSEVASGFLIPNLPQQDIATVSELAGCRSKRAAFKNVLTARLATDSKAKGLQNGRFATVSKVIDYRSLRPAVKLS